MAETLLNQQEPKLEPRTDTQRQNNRLKKTIGTVLALILIGLTVYVLKMQDQNYKVLSTSAQLTLVSDERAADNYNAYVSRYKATKIELDETTRKLEAVNQQLDQVTSELTTTKGMLSQTRIELAQAQDENARLKQELTGLNGLSHTASENVQNMEQLQSTIKELQDRDTTVSAQLDDLKTQLHAFEADFSSLPEGRSLIELFQSKIRLVKSRMHYLKQQAYFARVAAQQEKDRLAVLNGNSGFVIRNGQVQKFETKSFAIDVKIVQ